MSIYSTAEISALMNKYNQIEMDSIIQYASKPEQFLCYRLDGIKASKKYLKDTLSNERYNRGLSKATKEAHYSLKNKKAATDSSFFYCAFSASDEVSFVLNQGENYYNNRIFKIGTMLSGILSSAMTIHFESLNPNNKKGKRKHQKKEPPHKMAFDSRPLVLNTTEDVKEYIKFRCALACRNAACKVLRIESKFDIYEAGIKDDVEALFSKIAEYDLFDSYNKVIGSFSLYVPDINGKLITFELNDYESVEMMLSRLDETLTANMPCFDDVIQTRIECSTKSEQSAVLV